MPSSSYAGTVWFALMVAGRVKIQRGDTVFDIGCGVGRHGFTIRDLTDFAWGNFKKEKFEVNLVGVDVWPEYLQEIQKVIYSNLVCMEALDFLCSAFQQKVKSKLVILSHVIEHMERDHGLKVIEIARKISEWVIVILPLVKTPQGPVFGNKRESHISEWTLNELGAMSEYYEVAGRGIYPNGIFLIKGTGNVPK